MKKVANLLNHWLNYAQFKIYYVRYLIQGVEGVSEVASIGGFVKEYQIDVDPNKLFFGIHFLN